MLTLTDLSRAERLADHLRRVRDVADALRRDGRMSCEVRLSDIPCATVQTVRFLAMLAKEEAEIVATLRDLGVDATEVQP